ncbi:hypothetical protein NADFUDRAFT_82204 [Nadsonia fulvescens var. elongata DSM 6958]|uniref:ATP synthase subunit 4 n=1 Tax=Nadsonia fulvescens var. elongata DSM 6958 TaxID=857566 RepID=A0A1E3PME4_9ASCO|nr:hypothetical protein NADFUDRAFT_82204 [Nadsonia fulvescens var. elongata DSM 6958]
MSLRIAAASSLAALRPSVARSAVRAAPLAVRFSSTDNQPRAKAVSFIENLPGNSIVTKTGVLTTAIAGSIYAISEDLYVVNDETVLVGTFLSFVYLVGKFVGPSYSDWVNGQINQMKGLFQDARARHVGYVHERVETVSKLKDVVSVTKDLFAVSKETAQLEAQAFELKQQVAFAHEAKAVLDSWVRYEASVRQREQKALAESVIAKVEKEISTSKFQKDALNQAVAEVKRIFAKSA